MRTIISLCFSLVLSVPLASAASIEIIIRNDAGTIKDHVTILVNPANGSGNDVLLAIKDWRDAQLDNAEPPNPLFPDTQAGHEAFWGTVIIPPLKIKVLLFPWADLAAKKAISESTAADDMNAELRSAFQ